MQTEYPNEVSQQERDSGPSVSLLIFTRVFPRIPACQPDYLRIACVILVIDEVLQLTEI